MVIGIDASNEAIVFEILNQRKRGVRRVPLRLTDFIVTATGTPKHKSHSHLWPWHRTMAWKHIKRVMKKAGIADALCKPKALRHGFAVDAGQHGAPLYVVQRWLGHAHLETTVIYTGALGAEERNLARRAWSSLEPAILDRANSPK
jgi:integrase